jgi:hypothetical protein
MSEWVGVKDIKIKCPICGKPDWCMVHIDGKKVICPRVKSNVVMKKCGFLHKVFDNGYIGKARKHGKRKSNTCINWTSLARRYYRKGHTRIDILQKLSDELNIPVDELRDKWRLGWDGDAYTIPSYDGAKQMNGIMRRYPDGHKVWASRSRNGLFLPKLKSWEGNLFINEGWTDAAVMVNMGFRAIGRANCQTGLAYIKNLLYLNRGIGQVTIVGDNNPDNVHGNVGQRGMNRLAKDLYGGSYFLAVTEVPEKFKDMRQWRDGGATKEDVIYRSRRI